MPQIYCILFQIVSCHCVIFICGQRGLPLANLGVLKSSLDTSVAALNAIASQPPLTGNVDPSKIDEIRRTVYVGNLNSQVCENELNSFRGYLQVQIVLDIIYTYIVADSVFGVHYKTMQ